MTYISRVLTLPKSPVRLGLFALQMFLFFFHFLHCKCFYFYFFHFLHCKCFSINWNCSNSVSFHAICLKFFLVGPLKISLRVLAFSELSGRLPIATFAMLLCFCKIVCTANVFHFQFSTFPTLFNINNLLSNPDWPNLTGFWTQYFAFFHFWRKSVKRKSVHFGVFFFFFQA